MASRISVQSPADNRSPHTLTSFNFEQAPEQDNDSVFGSIFSRLKSNFVAIPTAELPTTRNSSSVSIDSSNRIPSQPTKPKPDPSRHVPKVSVGQTASLTDVQSDSISHSSSSSLKSEYKSRRQSKVTMPSATDKPNRPQGFAIQAAPASVSLTPAFTHTPTVEKVEPVATIGGDTVVAQTPARRSMETSGRPSFESRPSLGPSQVVSNPSPMNNTITSLSASSIPFPSVVKDRLMDADVMSIRSTTSLRQHNSVTRAIRRLRGEGLSKDYWMADDNCKECYDCRSPFTAFRRKHHCRICGQIFCNKCAGNLIPGERFSQSGWMRVCNLCLAIMEEYDDFDDDGQDHFSMPVSIAPVHGPGPISPDSQSRGFMSQPNRRLHYSASITSADIGYDLQSSAYPRSPSPSDTLDGPLRKMLNAGTSLFRQRTISNNINDFPRPVDVAPAPFRRTVDEDHPSHGGHDGVVDHELAKYMSDDEEEDRTRGSNNLMSFASLMSSSASKDGVRTAEDEDEENARGRMRRRSIRRRAQTPETVAVLDASTRERRKSLQSFTRPTKMKTNSLIRQYSLSIGDNMDMITPTLSEAINAPLMSQSGRSQSWHQHVELNAASLQHVRQLLHQSLRDANIPNVEEWAPVMMKLLLQVSDNLYPNIRAGDEIDIRHYVKIKKIPGGTPKDSEYIQGVVCTKNVSHKQMSRSLTNPRIMVLTFPLEYQRIENQFMSLEPVMAQEREYLKRLVARIVDQRPHIVLVERSVSRLALEYLLKAHVTVARNVKASVIEAVARCTQADIIPSLDKLAWEARLGRCGSFRIRTYEHELIPNRRKTYMFFDHCQRELGCTIVLRGADVETLEKLKQITDLMAFVVYNLKMETFLLRDEFAMVPLKVPTVSTDDLPDSSMEEAEGNTESPDDLSVRIEQAIKPYEDATLSASPFVKFPAPYPLLRMRLDDQKLRELTERRMVYMAKRAQDKAERAQALQSLLNSEGTDSTKFSDTVVKDNAARNVPLSSDTTKTIDSGKAADISHPPVEGPTPSQSSTCPPSPSHSTSASLSGSQISVIDFNAHASTGISEENPSLMSIVSDDAAEKEKDAAVGEGGEIPQGISNIEDIIKSSEEIKQDSDFYLAKKEHALQVRSWQSYITQSVDDISPFAHQNIAVLYSNVCSVTSLSCQGPEIQIIEYYRESDRTLGQYLEEMCFSTSFACPTKTCERPMLVHYRVYVHGEARVNVIVDTMPTPLPGMENSILMWSVCRICKKNTPVIPMSEETWKYSFGKYLELSFYNNEISCRADICPHNIHRDHIRYFGLKNLAMRFEYETIQLLEVVAPPIKLTQKPAILMRLKNKDLNTVQGKIASFWNSVSVRVRNFHYELVQPDKVEACRKELVAMNQKVEAERQEMIKLSQDTYMESKPTDTLALNVVRRIMQERVVQWDVDFGELERKYLPNEKDVRRMTASQIMRIFVDKESSEKGGTGTQTPIHEVLSGEEQSEKNVALGESTPVEEKTSNVDGNDKIVEEPASQTETSSINPSVETDLSESGSEAIRSGPESAIKGFRPQVLSRIESEKESEHETEVQPTPTKSSEHYHGQSRIPSRIKLTMAGDKHVNTPTASRPGSRSRRSSVDGKTSKIRQRSKAGNATAAVEAGGGAGTGIGMKGDVSDVDPRASNLTKVEPLARTAKISAPSAASQQRQGSVSTTPRPASRRLPSLIDGITSGGEGGPERGARNYAAKTASSKRRETDRSRPEAASRPSASRTSTSGRIPSMGTMGRVGTLARHYDRISKEIEKQHRFALVRGRRARPVATTKPIVSVFKNLKDAVKDESDDEDTGNDNEDADDEFEVDDDIKRSPPGKGKVAIRNGQTGASREVSMESYIYDAAAEQEAHGQDPSNIDKAVDKTEELLNEAAAQLTEGQVAETAPDDATAEAALRNGNLSESEYSTTGAERTSLMKTISNLWGDRNVADLLPLDYPLLPNEHVFEDSKVIVREDEPGSIIAFTLSSKDYREKLAAMQVAASPYRDAAIEKAKSYFEAGSEKGIDAAAASGNTTASAPAPGDGNDIDEGTQGLTGTHLKYQFQEGPAKLFCKIFFAEQFDSVRRNCGCDESYIESLARCIKWDSVAGGKSGSAFLKTRDDRLVMKELSRPEMHALLKFAPAYFDYMNQAFFTAMPTTLAKIFGFYRIGYKNPATGKSMRLDIIVMENLFYERKCSRIFDLKGSMRNRHVQSTGRENEVLLDENLIEFMNQSPLFIREHSKRMLRASLWNDTLFLAKLNVMDYSLVVGIDDNRHELVVGIIDIIRTFTWDKKLESWVKETAFLGGGGKGEPTIITPRQYKNRFREAMERYFLLVPDVWVSADSIIPPKQLKAKNREENSKAAVTVVAT